MVAIIPYNYAMEMTKLHYQGDGLLISPHMIK